MTRILLYIACGAMLVAVFNIGIPISKPLPESRNWAGIKIHYHEEWNKCYDSSHYQALCPAELTHGTGFPDSSITNRNEEDQAWLHLDVNP